MHFPFFLVELFPTFLSCLPFFRLLLLLFSFVCLVENVTSDISSLTTILSTIENTSRTSVATTTMETTVALASATTPTAIIVTELSETPRLKVSWSFDSNSSQPFDASNELPLPSLPHDFTDCCRSMNVSDKCIRYCSVHSLLNSSYNNVNVDSCIHDFPHIVKCTAGGRNHVPCCEKRNIPDVCQVFHRFLH